MNKDKQKSESAPENPSIPGEEGTASPDEETHNKRGVDSHRQKDEAWGELGKTVLLAILLALIVRTLFFEPFNIPSGSMKPTLLTGDYLFVSKTAYGYSRHSFPLGLAPLEGRVWKKVPRRGDVVVFKLPSNTNIDYIKRVIGLPGDAVQVKEGRLYINGEMVERKSLGREKVEDRFEQVKQMHKFLEILPGGVEHFIYEEGDDFPLDNTREFTVPEGHIFVMGDNRDNSQDSRVYDRVGPVPLENLVGRAEVLFFSVNGKVPLWQVWKWPWAIRYERLFDPVGPAKSPGQEA